MALFVQKMLYPITITHNLSVHLCSCLYNYWDEQTIADKR